MLFGNAMVQSHSLHMDKKVVGLVANIKKWRDAEKIAAIKAKKTKERTLKAEEATKKIKNELSMVRSKHSHYL